MKISNNIAETVAFSLIDNLFLKYYWYQIYKYKIHKILI